MIVTYISVQIAYFRLFIIIHFMFILLQSKRLYFCFIESQLLCNADCMIKTIFALPNPMSICLIGCSCYLVIEPELRSNFFNLL